VFGLVALVLLLWMAWTALRQAQTPGAKAIVATAIGWSFLFMATSGMRLVAPSFLFGLAFARIYPNLALKPGPLKNRKNLRTKYFRRTPNQNYQLDRFDSKQLLMTLSHSQLLPRTPPQRLPSSQCR
jgi:hypothetical protein